MSWTGAITSLATGSFILFSLTVETTFQMIDVYGVTSLVATANQIRELLAFRQTKDFPTHSLKTLHVGGGVIATSFAQKLRSEFLPARDLPLWLDGNRKHRIRRLARACGA